MKPISATNQGQRQWIWSTVRGVSHSLFGENRFLRIATPERVSAALSLGESLLDNIEGDFGYVAAVEGVEELLFQKELQADRSARSLVSPRNVS
jgi:hypothetical protein